MKTKKKVRKQKKKEKEKIFENSCLKTSTRFYRKKNGGFQISCSNKKKMDDIQVRRKKEVKC
jgi:hypothetical protein